VAGGEVEEVDCWGVEVDVEAVLERGLLVRREVDGGEGGQQKGAYFDSGEDGVLGYAVVAGVDDALCFGPALLCRPDGCPEDSLATAAGIACMIRFVSWQILP
jgi:hypothetical protein